MHKEVFIISVSIAFLIQIIHSILTKGWKFTLGFFGGGFLFGLVREKIFSFLFNAYEFPTMPVKFFNVPVFIPIGWIFTFYLAHEFVNKLIKPKTVKDYKDFIIIAAFFSTFICIPIETAALNMKWWTLTKLYINDNIASLLLMTGWFHTTIVFFYIYSVAMKKMPWEHLWVAFILSIAVFLTIFNWYVLAIKILILLPVLKFNKELTFLIIVCYILNYPHPIMTQAYHYIPNGLLVSIAFMLIFIFILVKLRFRMLQTNHA